MGKGRKHSKIAFQKKKKYANTNLRPPGRRRGEEKGFAQEKKFKKGN